MKNPIRSGVFILICSLMLLGSGLWISGKFVPWQEREKAKKQAGVRLVCIGDSQTLGVGTSAPYSYPKQLEKLLNSNNPGQKFSVINLGAGGSGTQAQSEVLRSFFENHRVDGVLWLTGHNNADAEIDGPSGASRAYADYMDLYLETARKLCKAHGTKLILLSYYNSADIAVKGFADKHRILFFDFRDDFSFFKNRREAASYVSPDGNHMNRFGYQFYSERLYENMFLRQKRLGLRLGPLLKKMRSVDFYSDPAETEKCVRSQQERVEQSRETWTYPFEQVQLGHIYSEIGREESARQCFMEGLISSHYSDHSMLVSPAIAWYLKRGERQEALRLCDDIVSKNPQNSIAKTYREILSQSPPGAWTSRLQSSLESID